MRGAGLAVSCFLVLGCGRVGFEPVEVAHGAGDPGRSGGDFAGLPVEPPPNDPSASVQVNDLRALWATPEWTFWFWTTTGVAGDLDTFEFTLAESMVEAINGVGSATTTVVQGVSLPPAFELRTLGGLLFGDRTPDTEYVALLIATDTEGRLSVTNGLPVRTQPAPTDEIVIFHDADTAGYSIPTELVRSTDAPYAGTHHYQWSVACASPPCYEILRRQQLGLELAQIDAGNFDRAFVEFAAASDSVPASSVSMLRMWFGTTADHDATTLYGFGSWFMRADDSYRVYQFPLAALGDLSDGDLKLTVDIANRGLFEMGIAGEWSVGSITRLDEWRIRW